MTHFSDWPTPRVLHWLSGGQLANRLLRAVRCWVWLGRLYGDRGFLATLPDPFRYGDLRSRVLAPSHPSRDTTTVAEMHRVCRGSHCLCQVSAQEILFRHHPDRLSEEWIGEVAHLAGLPVETVGVLLTRCPFATVHRTLRDDLGWLVQQGWLRSVGRGQWARVSPADWPVLPVGGDADSQEAVLSPREKRALLDLLEPITFLQPQLAVVVDTLWRQLYHRPTTRPMVDSPRRIFVHLDYILPDEIQDQVDQHQVDIEQLWHSRDGGVIQFDYWLARPRQSRRLTVYPVCFHYARRAKYLSAYGGCPNGQMGWHNYRLDRIQSSRLKILAWGDPAVPEELKRLRQTGQLPTPQAVADQLEEAWGFNFYLPKGLLIIRFEPEFARWYVQDTVRHGTFAPVAYGELAELIAAEVAPPQERAELLALVAQRPATDAYYSGWIRMGDMNVTMRLRDWRPKGEVLAPLEVRRQMIMEAQQELANYGV